MKDSDIRGLLLRRYYERRREGLVQLEPSEFADALSGEEIAHVSAQLLENGLVAGERAESIDMGLLGVFAKITAKGVDVAEGNAQPPVSIHFQQDSSIHVSGSHGVAIGDSNNVSVATTLAAPAASFAGPGAGGLLAEARADAKRMLDDNVLLPKRTVWEFLIDELIAYAAQFLTFLLALVLATNLLRDDKEIERLVGSRMAANPLLDLSLTVFAIAALIGAATLWQQSRPSGALKRFLEEYALEIPRTIYVVGSSLAALFAAVAIRIHFNPAEASSSASGSVAASSAMVALAAFLYGCGLSYFLKRRRFIRSKPAESAAAS